MLLALLTYFVIGLFISLGYVVYCKKRNIEYGWSSDYPPVEVVITGWMIFIAIGIVKGVTYCVEHLGDYLANTRGNKG
jgi:uncharacterized membrane protein